MIKYGAFIHKGVLGEIQTKIVAAKVKAPQRIKDENMFRL